MRINLKDALSTMLLVIVIITPLLPFFSEMLSLNVRYFDDVVLILFFIILFIVPGVKTSSYLNQFIMIFLLIFIVSFLMNIQESNLLAFLAQFRNYFLPLACFYVASFVNVRFINKKHFHVLIFFVSSLSIIGIIEGLTRSHLYQTYNQWGYPEFVGSIFRVHTLFTHPGDYGYYLLIFLSLIILFLQHHFISNVFLKRVVYLFALMLIFNILFTISMGPIFGFIISYFLTALLLRIKIGPKKIVTVFTIFFLSVVLIGSSMSERIQTRLDVSANSIQMQGQQATRVDFYLQSVPVITDNVFFGVGPGNFGGWVATKFNSFAHKKYNIDTYGLSSIDLFYPHIIGELGVFGAFAFFFIYVVVGQRNYKQYYQYKFTNNSHGMLLSSLVVFFVIMLFVCSFWTMIFESNIQMILFWVIVGFSEGYAIKYKNNLREIINEE